LLVGGSGGGILAEVLLQEEGCQLAGEGAGALLPLGEGDRGRILFGVEVEVEDGGSLLEPLLAEALTVSRGPRCSRVHGVHRGKGREAKATQIISPRRRSCNYGDGPFPPALLANPDIVWYNKHHWHPHLRGLLPEGQV
jgi:hypothetical protein